MNIAGYKKIHGSCPQRQSAATISLTTACRHMHSALQAVGWDGPSTGIHKGGGEFPNQHTSIINRSMHLS